MQKAFAGLIGLTAALVVGIASTSAQQPSRTALFKQLRLDGNFVRWPQPEGGGSVVLTYKVLEQFQSFDGARNCRHMTGIEEIGQRSHIARATFNAELHEALAMWEAAADIRFREAGTDETPNIVIGAQAEPEGWAFADVFYNKASTEAVKPISRSLVCLNPTKTWKIGFDGDLQVYDLRYTLAHELGHAIGLDHPNNAGQIMGYRYEEGFRELQAGDQSGAAELYGPPRGLTIAHSPEVKTTGVQAIAGQAERGGTTTRALGPNRN